MKQKLIVALLACIVLFAVLLKLSFKLVLIFIFIFCATITESNRKDILIDIEIQLHQDNPVLNKKQYVFLTEEQKEIFWNKKGTIKE